MKDLIRIADLSSDDLTRLLELGGEFKYGTRRHHGLLRDKSVACCFAGPSSGTRDAFETAILRLGGVAVPVGPAGLQPGWGEPIEDTARLLSHMAAAIVVETRSDDDVRRLAQAATVPVINAGTAGHHPTQALADMLTLREHFLRLRQLRVAYLGAATNVAHSLMEVGPLAGIDLTVATPDGYQPRPEVIVQARDRAERHGGRLHLSCDPVAAVKDAEVVYTDVWLPVANPESERAACVATLRPYQVNAALMGHASPNAVFLHGSVAHRGDEVTAEVINGAQSLVSVQAENRLPIAQAVLFALVSGELHGAGHDHRRRFGELIGEVLR
ncbi:MAG: ornithine carbamoyltransferase [Actinomycetota bacterium]|nr:ornithine carbamoyltransferase [Actinomycetota bacterium]